jgi:predicted nucleic acid-binding protein
LFSWELRTRAEILIDEKKAPRLAASAYDLNLLGTGGLMLRAKKRGSIAAVKPLLTELRTKDYFLSERLFEGIVRAAGE